MKPRVQPCLRDYLTIHVPASTLMGDRFKKREKEPEIVNPLMNKKLHANRNKEEIAFVYSSLPNRSFGKKRKIQTIPLLSNLKFNHENKLRVVKNPKKAQYNFVFQKTKPLVQIGQKQDNYKQHKRLIETSHSNKTLSRFNLYSQSTNRQSLSSLKHIDYFEKRFASTVFQRRSSEVINKKVGNYQNMRISGEKVPLSSNFPYYKKQIDQDNQNPFRKYSQSYVYIRHQ